MMILEALYTLLLFCFPPTCVNQHKALSLATVIIACIHVNGMVRELEGNIEKYTERRRVTARGKFRGS